RLAEQWGLELTDYDFLKVASMVQAEAGNVEEAPQIATVIYNRLAQGMPLGIDAVDRYGAELAGTEVDFTDGDLPYNTRRRPGLPPTPIAAPGEFALEAALVPADGDWLYYVLQEERSHVFVVTNAEFLEAKRICRERDLGCG
ncbi:MAG TPA: endolytic transglycosylase MltG, partial [Acidimicrobiales bacterium]|nr:endolytic transglycosylase MltG [Acidimicrobiales bacterium]